MIFAIPTSLNDASKLPRVRALLPRLVTSKDVQTLGLAVKSRAARQARILNAQYLDEANDILDRVLEQGLAGTARKELRELATRLGYDPGDKAGTIQDLTSDQRLNLIVRTQTEMAQNYGRWKEGQEQAILDVWPAQEFYRAEEREEHRPWPDRWRAAGGRFFEGAGDYPEGRMIALKNDPIWQRLSRFDQPFPPFDFNSGMDVRDVERDEAVELGLIRANEFIVPETRGMDEDVPVPEIHGRLREVLDAQLKAS